MLQAQVESTCTIKPPAGGWGPNQGYCGGVKFPMPQDPPDQAGGKTQNVDGQRSWVTMDSAVAKMSSMTFLPLLALLVAANTAVGFIAPSLHVGSVQHSAPSTRCRVTSNKAGLRGGVGSRSVGLSMEVESHVLRLQAAELGSRLRVRSNGRRELCVLVGDDMISDNPTSPRTRCA